MENPAIRLLAIYREWEAAYPNEQPYLVRQVHTTEGTARHLEVFALLARLDLALTEMASRRPNAMRVYRAAFEGWVRMGLNYPANWQGGAVNAASVFPPHDLDHLETFAELLDSDQPPLSESSMNLLRSVVGEALELLDNDDSISQPLRVYLLALIDELRRSLDEEAILDDFEYRKAAERLWVALQAASADSSDPERKKKWMATAKRMTEHVASGTLVALSSVALTAITGG